MLSSGSQVFHESSKVFHFIRYSVFPFFEILFSKILSTSYSNSSSASFDKFFVLFLSNALRASLHSPSPRAGSHEFQDSSKLFHLTRYSFFPFLENLSSKIFSTSYSMFSTSAIVAFNDFS